MNFMVMALGLFAQQASLNQDTPQPSSSEPVLQAVEPRGLSTETQRLFAELPPSLDDYERRVTTDRGRLSLRDKLMFDLVGREDLSVRTVFVQSHTCALDEDRGLDDLIAAARQAQIVVINEVTFTDATRHRAMTARLLEALADDFDILASTHFNHRRLEWEMSETVGPYHNEPIYARMIETARANGYRLVSISHRSIPDRLVPDDESAPFNPVTRSQVASLQRHILDEDPTARVIIHLPLSLADERAPQPAADPSQTQQASQDAPSRRATDGSFAWLLREATGIDPFTITQGCRPAPGPDLETGSEGVEEPASVVWPDQLADPATLNIRGRADAAIPYFEQTFSLGRPNWRRALGDVEVTLPEALLPVDNPVIYEVRASGRSIESAPIERLLLYPGEAWPLLLPPGEWGVTAWTEQGAYGQPVTLSVGAP